MSRSPIERLWLSLGEEFVARDLLDNPSLIKKQNLDYLMILERHYRFLISKNDCLEHRQALALIEEFVVYAQAQQLVDKICPRKTLQY